MLRHARRQRGAALLHVLVAAVILALALVETVGTVLVASLLDRTTARKTHAAHELASIVEEVRAADPATLRDVFDGATRTVDDGSGQPATAAVHVTDITPVGAASPLYRVRVELAFGHGETHEPLVFATIVGDRSICDGSASTAADLATPDGVLLNWVTYTESEFTGTADTGGAAPDAGGDSLSAGSSLDAADPMLVGDSLSSGGSADSGTSGGTTSTVGDPIYDLLRLLIATDYE